MWRTIILTFFLTCACPFSAQSFDFEGDLNLRVKSEDIFPNGTRIAGPVANIELDLKIGRCVYGNIWASVGLLEGDAGRYGNRFEYTLGCHRELSRKVFIDFGVRYYHFLNVGQKDKGDAVQPYIRVDRPFWMTPRHTLSPFLETRGVLIVGEWDDRLRVEDGSVTSIGLVHKWKLETPIFEIADFTQELSFLYDSGAGALADDAVIGNYEAEFGLLLTQRWSLEVLSARLVFPITTNRWTTIKFHGNQFRVIEDARRFWWTLGAGLKYRF
jgi:hypothetical protein